MGPEPPIPPPRPFLFPPEVVDSASTRILWGSLKALSERATRKEPQFTQRSEKRQQLAGPCDQHICLCFCLSSLFICFLALMFMLS